MWVFTIIAPYFNSPLFTVSRSHWEVFTPMTYTATCAKRQGYGTVHLTADFQTSA